MRKATILAGFLISLMTVCGQANAQSHYSTGQSQESFSAGLAFERRAEENGGTEGLEEAAAAYRRAIQADPGMVPAYIRLGFVLYALNRSDEAIEVLEKGLKHQPSNVDLRQYLGLNLYQTGRVDEAEQILREVVSQDDEQRPEAYLVLGKIYLERGDYENAQVFFERYAQTSPSDVRAWQALSSAYIQARDMDRAEEALSNLIDLSPDDEIALVNMGHVQFELGNGREAVAYYERALEINPKRDDLKYTIASVFYLYGDYQEAIKRFEEVLKTRKTHMAAQYFIADSKLKLGNLNDAERDFLALGEKMPDYRYLKLKVALIHYLRGDRGAVQEIRKLLKGVSHPDEMLFGAVMLRTLGEDNRALEMHAQLAAAHPDNPLYRVYLARDYIEGANYDEAQKILEAAASEGKEPLADELLSYVLLHRGTAMMMEGKLDDAQKYYERAREIGVHELEALCSLVQVQILNGKITEARQQFDQVREMNTSSPAVIKMAAEFDLMDGNAQSAADQLENLATGRDWEMNGAGWYLLAVARTQLGQWQESLDALEHAEKFGVKETPATAAILLQVALIEANNGLSDKALTRALQFRDQMTPIDRVRLDYLSALGYLKNRKFSQAKTALEHVRNEFGQLDRASRKKITPDGKLDLSFEQAFVQFELGNDDAALGMIAGLKTPEAKQLEAAVRRRMAFAALKNKKFDAALDHYNKLNALGNLGNIDQYNQFLAQLQAKKVSDPKSHFEKAIRQGIHESLLNYAIYLDKVGDGAQAMQYYKKYLEQGHGAHKAEVEQLVSVKTRVWGNSGAPD